MDTTICFLAANKCDAEVREVDEVEARLWAELHGFIYCETSANTGLGITDMFQVSLTLTENIRNPKKPSHCCQGFFSQIVRLAESGMGSKTPKSGKRPVRSLRFRIFLSLGYKCPLQVSTLGRARDRLTVSPGAGKRHTC